MDIFVFGGENQALLIARLDNPGKGASGAAVQSMNVHLGVDEALGLEAVGSSLTALELFVTEIDHNCVREFEASRDSMRKLMP